MGQGRELPPQGEGHEVQVDVDGGAKGGDVALHEILVEEEDGGDDAHEPRVFLGGEADSWSHGLHVG